jgi:hypothetical protein
LSHLEAQNAISRRRVRELEAELQTCKQQVENARMTTSTRRRHERNASYSGRRDAETTRDLDIEDQGIYSLVKDLSCH